MSPDLLRMHTTFQFMRIIPAIAYKVNDAISISGAVHLAYGSLDMGATIGTLLEMLEADNLKPTALVPSLVLLTTWEILCMRV
jgi:long-subunit fatty acid transport protein